MKTKKRSLKTKKGHLIKTNILKNIANTPIAHSDKNKNMIYTVVVLKISKRITAAAGIYKKQSSYPYNYHIGDNYFYLIN